MPLAAAQRLLRQARARQGASSSRTAAASATERTRSCELLKPALAPLGLEADNDRSRTRSSTADAPGAAFMSFFTTFGIVLDRGRHPADLPDLRDARGRAARRARDRACGRHAPRPPRADVPVRGHRLRPAAAAVGALLGIAVAYGMVLAMAERVRDRRRPPHHLLASKPTSIVLAYAIGVLLTLVVVAFSAWRVSRMNIVTRDPQPSGAAAPRRSAGAAGCSASPGSLLGAAARRRRASSCRGRGRARARRLDRDPRASCRSLRPSACPTGPSTPAPGSRSSHGSCCRSSRWLFGDPKVNFAIFVLGGLMIVVGATWTIDVQRRRAARRARRGDPAECEGSRRSCGCRWRIRSEACSGPASRSRCSRSSSSRWSSERRRPARSGTPSTTSDAFGGGFDVRATSSPAAPIADMRFGRRPRATDCGRATSGRREPSRRSPVKARQLGTTAEGGLVRRPRRRRRLPPEHDLQARRLGARLLVVGGGLGRDPDAPQPGGRRPVRRAAPRRTGPSGLLPTSS